MPYLALQFRRALVAVAIASAWFQSLGHASAQTAEQPATPAPLTLGCVASQPVAHPQERVAVSAWATDPSGTVPVPVPKVTWATSTGKIAVVDGGKAVWTFPPGKPKGPLKVTATATLEGGGSCLVTLVFAKRPLDSGEKSARGLLTGKALLPAVIHDAETDRELRGYGLYSYFLLGSPPKDDFQKAKYKRAIEAYLQQLPSMVELGNHAARSQLNIALLPVNQTVQLPDHAEGLVKISSALLHDYDYGRAKVILQGLSDSPYEDGPYLVAIRPASSGGARVSAILDMSRASPEVSVEWVRTFCWLVAAERSWDEVTLRKMRLELRNLLSITARRVPEMFDGARGLLGLAVPP